MLQSATLSFLKALAKNNNKPWFDQNRSRYEMARQDFTAFIEALLLQFGKQAPELSTLTAKDCLFRINRDVRFSKDKSPYKINFAASLTQGGKKSPLAGYYFHLEPGRSFVGGGLYNPGPDLLRMVRQEIDYSFSDFKQLLAARKFKTLYGELDRSKEFLLSRVPKGYEADHPAAAFLKLKSFIAFHPIADAELSSKDLLKKTTAACIALQPLIQFLNKAVS